MEGPQFKFGGRRLSLLEFLLGALIVIGYNIFHVLPNEVPILVVLGLISFRLRDGGWAAMGLRRPPSWLPIVLIALAAAALRILFSDLVIEPVTAQFWPEAKVPEGAEEITGNIKTALFYFVLIWTFAAFGEEVAYRGYLMTRAADVGSRSKGAYLIALILTAILFGYGHYYKGPSGIIDSGFAGLVLGGAYLISGRYLWTSILAHGFINTVGLIVLFFGWDS